MFPIKDLTKQVMIHFGHLFQVSDDRNIGNI